MTSLQKSLMPVQWIATSTPQLDKKASWSVIFGNFAREVFIPVRIIFPCSLQPQTL